MLPSRRSKLLSCILVLVFFSILAIGGVLSAQAQTLVRTPSAVLTPERAQVVEEALTRLGPNTTVQYSTSGPPRYMEAADGSVLQNAVNQGTTREAGDIATAQAFLTANKNLMMLDDPTGEMTVTSYKTDNLGLSHVRFQQMIDGLEIWPCEMIVHLDQNGNVEKMAGGTVPTPTDFSVEPTITASKAAQVAQASVPETEGTPTVSEPELMVYALSPAEPTLAFRVKVTFRPDASWTVYVNAGTGEVLKVLTNIRREAVTGSGTDLLGKTRSPNIWKLSSADAYAMIDTTKDMYSGDGQTDPDWDAANSTGLILAVDFQKSDQEGFAVLVTNRLDDSGWLADAVSAWYTFSNVYDFYLNTFGLNSFDGNKISIYGCVRYGTSGYDAFYSGSSDKFFFGYADYFVGAVDVVAHEFTHGVTAHSAKLVYLNQSGAMNEAFSDIFGESCEHYVKGSNDWLGAAELKMGPVRNYMNPGAINYSEGMPYPSKMSEYYTLGESEEEDYGGVHVNSTILTHAYYLLAAGLAGAIGIEQAQQIFYRALTTHLTASSEFADCRTACIASANELYGNNCTQGVQVAAAFDAVEITGGSGSSVSQIQLTSPYSMSIENNQATIGIGRISNTGTSGTSEELTLWLKASTTKFEGGTFTGYDLASAALGTLAAGDSFTDVEKTSAYSAPPQGTYYVTHAVTENVNGSEVIVAYYTSDTPSELGPTSSSTTESSSDGGGGGCFLGSGMAR